MLEPIYIEATKTTPMVKFDKENQIFEISGQSLPEDAVKFYKDLLNWIKEYSQNPNNSTVFNIKLDYYNSSSARVIVKMIIELENILITGNDVKVMWYYRKDDEFMKRRGEEIRTVVLLPFEIKELHN